VFLPETPAGTPGRAYLRVRRRGSTRRRSRSDELLRRYTPAIRTLVGTRRPALAGSRRQLEESAQTGASRSAPRRPRHRASDRRSTRIPVIQPAQDFPPARGEANVASLRAKGGGTRDALRPAPRGGANAARAGGGAHATPTAITTSRRSSTRGLGNRRESRRDFRAAWNATAGRVTDFRVIESADRRPETGGAEPASASRRGARLVHSPLALRRASF